MKKLVVRVGAAALLAVVFQGCDGDDDTTGSNGAKGGGAGTKSSGGTSGKGGSPSGGKSAQSGSGGSSAGKSGKGGAGHGGSAGRGGGSPGGAGQGGAGDGGGGSGNDGIGTDPACHCVPEPESAPDPGFRCTMTLEKAQEVAVPVAELCDVQDSYFPTTRASCDHDSYLYQWDVGSENTYRVQRDSHGKVVYFWVYGFNDVMQLCGVPRQYEYSLGIITAGEPVGECNTDERCDLCSSHGEGGAAGASGHGGASGNGGAGAGGTEAGGAGNELPVCSSL